MDPKKLHSIKKDQWRMHPDVYIYIRICVYIYIYVYISSVGLKKTPKIRISFQFSALFVFFYCTDTEIQTLSQCLASLTASK